MTPEEIAPFIEKLLERDRDRFDLNGLIESALARCGPDRLGLREVMADFLKTVGPLIFEAGFLHGAEAGMELLRNEMSR